MFLLSDLWNVYDECENFAVLKGHSGAIMELHFNIDGRYKTAFGVHTSNKLLLIQVLELYTNTWSLIFVG